MLGSLAADRRLAGVHAVAPAALPYGAQWFWLAALSAEQSNAGEAVRLLRRAAADGLPFELFIHTDPHLARLTGEPAFLALVRPRG